jgi:hypothetical protein
MDISTTGRTWTELIRYPVYCLRAPKMQNNRPRRVNPREDQSLLARRESWLYRALAGIRSSKDDTAPHPYLINGSRLPPGIAV